MSIVSFSTQILIRVSIKTVWSFSVMYMKMDPRLLVPLKLMTSTDLMFIAEHESLVFFCTKSKKKFAHCHLNNNKSFGFF